MHDHAVRALAVDHSFKHVRQGAGRCDSKQHLIGFAPELRRAVAQTAVEPK
jgi:hypothetical protein